MKILILYISLTGRTKMVAESIAEELKSHDVSIESFNYPKKGKYLIKEQEKIKKGDLSSVSYNKAIEDLSAHDLVFFGTPTHGGQPAAIFYGFLEHVKNINGKKFVLFATGRMIKGKVLKSMESEIEKKGGSIVNKKFLKSLFKMRISKVNNFTEELSQELRKLNLI